jgi:kinesin family protein 5
MEVFVKIKPRSTTESAVTVESKNISILSHKFKYADGIIEGSDQGASFEKICDNLLNKFASGFSTTIMAYGQTGSGKTFTLLGAPGSLTETNLHTSGTNAPKEWGIFPRAAFKILESHQNDSLYASAVEVYQECGYDLLNNRSFLTLKSARTDARGHHPCSCTCFDCHNERESNKNDNRQKRKELIDKKQREGLSSDDFSFFGETLIQLKNREDVAHLVRTVELLRTRQAHNINQHSSRSHCLVKLRIKKTSFLFVDLAGSERILKSGAVGIAMNQAIVINESLSALGRVITALSRKASHIPFRDSALTKLMSSSLKGKSFTTTIICVADDYIHADESVCALKFGQNFKCIKVEKQAETISNSVTIVADIKSRIAILVQRQKELDECGRGEGHISPKANETNARMLQENMSKFKQLEQQVWDLKKEAAEGNHRIGMKEMSGKLSDLRDVILRQQTIKDLWVPANPIYIQITNEIKELRQKLMLFE